MSAAVATFVNHAALEAAAPAWGDLCTRACDANPFAEPGFLLPLIAYERPHATFVLIHEGERLIGFAALRLPPFGLAKVWTSIYAPLPACAFDAEAAPAALAALTKLLRARTRLAGIVWPFIEEGGRFATALAAAGAPTISVRRRQRSALNLAASEAFDARLQARRAKGWARQARRLADQGAIETIPGPEGVEAFLDLERRGWKGARGTALANDPARLTFARTALAAFASAGRLDALTLRLDGAPIAAGVALMSGARAFYWKSAYDETHAETSPGAQLALAHSRRLAATPGLQMFDSCTVEDHPLINRMWPDRLAFADIATGLRPGGAGALARWVGLERARARARASLKSWVNRARGRKAA